MKIIFPSERAQDALLEDQAGLRAVHTVDCLRGPAAHPAHTVSHGGRT